MPVGRTAMEKAIHRVCETNSAGPIAVGKSCDHIPNPGLYFQGFGYLGVPASQPEVARLLESRDMVLPAAGVSRVNGGCSGMAEAKVGSIRTPEAKKRRISTKSTPEKEARVVAGAGARETAQGRFEIPMANFALHNSMWDGWLHKNVKNLCAELGIRDVHGVVPRLSKLLIYCKQCNMAEVHSDTPPAPNDKMFATMVVVISSVFQGGLTIVEHMGQRTEVTTTVSTFDGGAVLAWYTGLKYTMEEITEGVRMCLVYTLEYEGPRTIPRPPTDLPRSPAVLALRKVIENWSKENKKHRNHFVWLFGHESLGHQHGTESCEIKWCDSIVGSAMKIATAGTSIGLELVTLDGRQVHSQIIGRTHLEKHDVIQLVDLSSISGKGMLLYSSCFGDVLVQMRMNRRSVEDRFAYFRENVTESISDAGANELAEIVPSLKGCDYDSAVIDFLSNCAAIKNHVDPQRPNFMSDLARSYVLRGPHERLFKFLSTSDNSLAKTVAGQEIEAMLRSEGLDRIGSLQFWTDAVLLMERSAEHFVPAFLELVPKDVQQAFVLQLTDATSCLRGKLAVPQAISILRRLKRGAEALQVVPSLFRHNYDMLDGTPHCYSSPMEGNKHRLLFGVLQDFASQANVASQATLKRGADMMDDMNDGLRGSDAIRSMNAHFIKLDDHSSRMAPAAVRSTYSGMWCNHSFEAAPQKDPLLSLFKAAPDGLRSLFIDVARYLVSQYAALCEKTASLAKDDYLQFAAKVSHPDIQKFLRDPSQQECRIFGSKDQRKHLHRQLEGIDVSHESTGYGGRGATLVIRKKHTRAQANNAAQTQHSATLRWLRAEVQRLEGNAVSTVASGEMERPAEKKIKPHQNLNSAALEGDAQETRSSSSSAALDYDFFGLLEEPSLPEFLAPLDE